MLIEMTVFAILLGLLFGLAGTVYRALAPEEGVARAAQPDALEPRREWNPAGRASQDRAA